MTDRQKSSMEEEIRRTVLVADDEPINRELLGVVLSPTYEVLYANDGQEALNVIRTEAGRISLVLLDLNMPVISGFQLLDIMRNDGTLRTVPVIVVTADQESEVKSLDLGAVDFIPKPFPRADIILARVQRTIELYEDRDLIAQTERDSLTGLYNRSYFYRHAVLFDNHHPGVDTDAIIVDVNHFRMINERFGAAHGDMVLKHLATGIREAVRDSGGIVCRREADTFMVYCPHIEDPSVFLDDISAAVNRVASEKSGVRLRMGVYPFVDKNMDIERRFDRADIAADKVRGNLTHLVGVYDSVLHQQEIYAERLVDEFAGAIAERQFAVYYQPKFDIRHEIPVLTSAEALVRWIHPELGMISPGVFIPLFEENGLIQTLDRYVWREAARQIRDWKDRFGFSVPVSVNMSRVDMYDPELANVLQSIINIYDLEPSELLLEITESAYTRDSAQIISTVNRLRSLGFQIEMDDFGTGYSSLSILSTLPLDALKLDMQFIRAAFKDRQDTRMLEIIIDIAAYLGVPVIAEGVETKDQLDVLKALGCDVVQGYYFSRPVPGEEYERFVVERRDMQVEEDVSLPDTSTLVSEGAFSRIAYALACGYRSIYYIDAEDGHYVMFDAEGAAEDLQIQSSGEDFFVDCEGWIRSAVFPDDWEKLQWASDKERLLFMLDDREGLNMDFRLMEDGKPVLCQLRAISVDDDGERYVILGVSEVAASDERDRDLDADRRSIATYSGIARALAQDYFCIYYVNTDNDRFIQYSADEEYQKLDIPISGGDFFGLSRTNAHRLVYHEDLATFLAAFTKDNILETLKDHKTFTLTYRLLFEDHPTYVGLKATRMEDAAGTHLIVGISNVDEQMRREQEYTRKLLSARELANRDPLTGVKSQHAYAEMEAQMNHLIAGRESDPFTIVFCDVNGLKRINDTKGHAAGDQWLKDACSTICHIFKHSPVFRVGGDEFVVIAYGHDNDSIDALMEQLEQANERSRAAGGVTIASGKASYNPSRDGSVLDVFQRADAAMYENKRLMMAE